MRITNNMMLKTTMANIYINKENVNTLNTQMSSQKKITRPSEDPVVAIRALRLRSSLSEIDQYYERNIPDAEAWLDVTETALNNMQSILSDVRTQCVYGATDTLTMTDRDAILQSLTQLRKQLYSEGNTDYAGRTVFTGFRTNCNLTFDTNEKDTTYEITQSFSKLDIEKEHRYYKGDAQVPTDAQIKDADAKPVEIERMDCDRIRLAYAELSTEGEKDATGETNIANFELTFSYKDADGNTVSKDITEMLASTNESVEVKTFATVADWKKTMEEGAFSNGVASNEVIVIAETGEMLLGKGVTTAIEANDYELSVDYSKKGFTQGEIRPEYYFNCKDVTDVNPENHITYQKFDENGNEIPQDINYVIAQNQTLTINTNASDVFNADAGRDVDEMINVVQNAIDAHDKVAQIEKMMGLEEYASEENQKRLVEWKEVAQKEADFADDNLKKLFNTYIGNFDSYLTDVNLAITTVGSKGDQLALTETRMSNQQLTITELKSANEDKELSDIIIEYTSAYTAYQGALQAASKINQSTLLNYI